MTKKQRIERLKANVFSDDWETQKWACHDLFHFGGRFNKTGRRKNRRFLVGLLGHEDPHVRNAVALLFRDSRYQPALNSLLEAIKNPANARHNGTMAYALEKLDCSRKLGELFEVVFGAANNFEVLQHTLTALNEQHFRINNDKLHQIARRWEEVKPTWDELNTKGKSLPGDFTQAVIQDFVDDFMAYLK